MASETSDSASGPRRRRTRPPRGLVVVLASTAIAGATGYGIQAVAGFALSPADYAAFGVFWAALYLVIGGISGIQQEVARATHAQHEDHTAKSPLTVLVIVFAVAVVGLVCLTAPLYAPRVFGSSAAADVAAIAVGGVSYVALATVSGVLYGRREWTVLGIVVISDPALRLILIAFAFFVGGAAYRWAVVIPIALTVVIALIGVRVRRLGRSIVDVGARRLVANTAKTIVGATATSVMVSGLPLFIGTSAHGDDPSAVGAMIFNITVTRAPLVIPLLALQSYLVVHFRDRAHGVPRAVMRILGALLAGTIVLAALAWVLVPTVLGSIFGQGYVLDGMVVAALVASAGLTAALCVTGPALIAQSRHIAFLAGWVVSAALVIALLFLPLPLEARVMLALGVSPIAGLAAHLAGLMRGSAQDVPKEASDPAPITRE